MKPISPSPEGRKIQQNILLKPNSDKVTTVQHRNKLEVKNESLNFETKKKFMLQEKKDSKSVKYGCWRIWRVLREGLG